MQYAQIRTIFRGIGSNTKHSSFSKVEEVVFKVPSFSISRLQYMRDRLERLLEEPRSPLPAFSPRQSSTRERRVSSCGTEKICRSEGSAATDDQ